MGTVNKEMIWGFVIYLFWYWGSNLRSHVWQASASPQSCHRGFSPPRLIPSFRPSTFPAWDSVHSGPLRSSSIQLGQWLLRTFERKQTDGTFALPTSQLFFSPQTKNKKEHVESSPYSLCDRISLFSSGWIWALQPSDWCDCLGVPPCLTGSDVFLAVMLEMGKHRMQSDSGMRSRTASGRIALSLWPVEFGIWQITTIWDSDERAELVI